MDRLWKKFEAAAQKLRNVKREEHGFSLVEVIISLAVVAVLVSIAAPVYGNVKEASRINAVKAAARDGLTAATAAVNDGNPATTTVTAMAPFNNGKMQVYFYNGYAHNVYTDSPTDEEYGPELFCVRADIVINGAADYSYGRNTGPGCDDFSVDSRYVF